MKIIDEKVDDTRKIDLSVEDAAEYPLFDDIILLPREICIVYRRKGRFWRVFSVNIDGWRKGKPETPEWWIWTNATEGYREFPQLRDYVDRMMPNV